MTIPPSSGSFLQNAHNLQPENKNCDTTPKTQLLGKKKKNKTEMRPASVDDSYDLM